MDLDFVLLADGVSTRGDGKLDIFGGGLDTVFTPSVPTVHSHLLIVARVLVSRTEFSRPHTFGAVVRPKRGQPIMRTEARMEAMPKDKRANIPRGRKAGAGFLLGFQNIVFTDYGEYEVVIQWDGTEVRDPLRLFVEPPAQ